MDKNDSSWAKEMHKKFIEDLKRHDEHILKQGEIQGRKQEKVDLAYQLLIESVDLNIISQVTGISNEILFQFQLLTIFGIDNLKKKIC